MRMIVLCLVLMVSVTLGFSVCGAVSAAGSGEAAQGQAQDGIGRVEGSNWVVEKRDMKAIARVFSGRLDMAESQDPAMHVRFPHTKHKGLGCAVCHHKISANGERYTSCAAPGCHTLGEAGMDPRSRFQAIHKRESERSCYGCHFEQRAALRDIKGCTSCHKDRSKARKK